jgi:hypothetical protein
MSLIELLGDEFAEALVPLLTLQAFVYLIRDRDVLAHGLGIGA